MSVRKAARVDEESVGEKRSVFIYIWGHEGCKVLLLLASPDLSISCRCTKRSNYLPAPAGNSLPISNQLSSITINCVNSSSQFWTWQPARRRCSPPHTRMAEFRSARSMEAAPRFTRRKPAPWRCPNGDRGGTWTCWNRTWCSWCDWTSASRAAVSNTVYFFALRRLREFTVLRNKWTLANHIFLHPIVPVFNELVQRVAHPVKVSISRIENNFGRSANRI